eukprot:gene16707-18402_t
METRRRSTRQRNAIIKQEEDEDAKVQTRAEIRNQNKKKLTRNIVENTNERSPMKRAKSSLKATLPSAKPSKTYGLKREKKPKEPPPPRRSSLRLQRMDPLGIPLPEIPEDEKKTLSEQKRKPTGPIEMKACNVEQDVCSRGIQQWLDLSLKCSKKKNVLINGESEAQVDKYRKGIESLSIAEKHASKVTPNRIFSLAMHPMESRLLVIAGSKWGRIGIWDTDSNEGQDGVYLFEPHTRPINVVSVQPEDHSKIYSCSYDGTLRCCDLEKQLFTEVYAEAEDEDVSLNAFAWIAKSRSTVVVGKNDFTVGVIDVRSGREESNFVAHAKLVRWIDCHPLNENLIATSCQDGSVATWDLRKAKTIKSKLSEISCHRVTSSVFFSPQTGNKILTTSLDDTIRVYDVNTNGAIQPTAKCMIKHYNQTGRWLTKFRAAWDPKTDNCFVVGSMAQPRSVDFYTSDGKGRKIACMNHENLSSITSLNVFHPSLNVLAGGNSSGKVFLWK